MRDIGTYSGYTNKVLPVFIFFSSNDRLFSWQRRLLDDSYREGWVEQACLSTFAILLFLTHEGHGSIPVEDAPCQQPWSLDIDV